MFRRKKLPKPLFRKGDYVRVVSGPYENDRGVVACRSEIGERYHYSVFLQTGFGNYYSQFAEHQLQMLIPHCPLYKRLAASPLRFIRWLRGKVAPDWKSLKGDYAYELTQWQVATTVDKYKKEEVVFYFKNYINSGDPTAYQEAIAKLTDLDKEVMNG
jgi:hypothetical protein